jgi:kelch-like protein 2/3
MLKQGGCGATGVVGGKLYVYTACPKISAYFQRYDPATNSWKALALPAFRHSYPAAGVISGKLYVAGGIDNGVATAVVEIYDPATNTWGKRPSMPTARWAAVGSVIEGLWYVVGGAGSDEKGLATLEVYEPVSETWRARPFTLTRNQAYTP